MIKSIELGNFLSHRDTKIDFDNRGVTVFIGNNGAGKSSVVDGITFALFGKHTRKNNNQLIRKGKSQGYTRVDFMISEKNYRVERKIENKTTWSKLLEEKDGKWITIVEGERKQFGESVTRHIEGLIGMDFEKLKVASIVQQGELNTIIKAKPKEFKELINTVIGIDKLDIASERLKILLKKFREEIKQKYNYDDTQITFLERQIDEREKEIKNNMPIKKGLEERKQKINDRIAELEEKNRSESKKAEKLELLRYKKKELVEYAKKTHSSILEEIKIHEDKVKDCEARFNTIKNGSNSKEMLDSVESKIEDATKKVQNEKLNQTRLVEQEKLAKKLQLSNGRCPVCDTRVEILKPIFQQDHIRKEIIQANENIQGLEREISTYSKRKKELKDTVERIKDAEAVLRTHKIKNISELETIKEQISTKKLKIQKIPTIINQDKLKDISSLDSHTTLLYDKITILEEETRGFNLDLSQSIKIELEQKRKELVDLSQRYGSVINEIKRNQEQCEQLHEIVIELGHVSKYMSRIENIQKNVFDREGPVSTSFRTWAHNTISVKASEYLSVLNTDIQRIELSEKSKDVSITCYTKSATMEINSLSGGEQVSVALSIRLGMAHLIGSSRLDLIVLDEPTMHLDVERRKLLVKVLSQLSDVTSDIENSKTQFIIITHDSEIFEDASVEQMYQFSSNLEKGTIVKLA